VEISARSMADSIPLSPRRARNIAGLDGRLRTARRLKSALAELVAQFGDAETPLLQRCAELQVLATSARARLVRGDTGITIDEVVKLENLSARALRDLRARTKRGPPSAGPTLAEYLAAKGAAAEPEDEPEDEPAAPAAPGPEKRTSGRRK
jgi:hypothetical protein